MLEEREVEQKVDLTHNSIVRRGTVDSFSDHSLSELWYGYQRVSEEVWSDTRECGGVSTHVF